MPSSDPTSIGTILEIVRELKPQSILDIGVGCGKYGVLFREYLDGHWVGRAFHDKGTWKTTIIGMEIWHAYITPVHDYVYNEIVLCDAYDYLKEHNHLGHFDLIFMGDTIEHFSKDKGMELIQILRDKWLKSGGHLLLSTPNFKTQINNESLAVFGNHHEVHRCRWSADDFKNLGMKVTVLEGRHIIANLEKL